MDIIGVCGPHKVWSMAEEWCSSVSVAMGANHVAQIGTVGGYVLEAVPWETYGLGVVDVVAQENQGTVILRCGKCWISGIHGESVTHVDVVIVAS